MKKNTLYYLEKANGNYVSGESIAESLGVSRMTVSKEVAALRKEGAEIEASTKLGYKLVRPTKKLHPESIYAHLPDGYEGDIFCFDRINSTNDKAKSMAADGALDATIITADEQTSGRGRYGRSFFSPSESGLYMSIIIRPKTESSDVMYTVAAAVAVRRVLSEYNEKAKIKWVNDVYVEDKKICGILCEAVSDLESGAVSAVICGIGINLSAPKGGFPDDIKNKAGYISAERIPKAKIAARIASELYEVLEMNGRDLISEYSYNMMLTGKEIYYIKNNIETCALVKGVDEKGGLVVSLEGDKLDILRSGEVTLEKFQSFPKQNL